MKGMFFLAALIVSISITVSAFGVIAGFYMFGLTEAVICCGNLFLLVFLVSMVWIAVLNSKKAAEEAEKQTKLLEKITEKLNKNNIE